MDATPQTALTDSEIINEPLSLVTHCFKSANSPYGLRNNQRTTVEGDTWIQQPKQPYGSNIINELLSRVTHVFDSPKSP